MLLTPYYLEVQQANHGTNKQHTQVLAILTSASTIHSEYTRHVTPNSFLSCCGEKHGRSRSVKE